MKVSSKIAASSGLFVVLLGGVLVYQVSLVRSLVAVNRDFSSTHFRAAILALDLIELINEVREFARKLNVTRDPDYAVSWAEREGLLTARLEELEALELAPAEARSAVLLERAWAAFRRDSVARLGRDELLASERPGGSEAADEEEIALAALENEAEIVDQWLEREILGLQEHARALVAATRRSIAGRVELSNARSREAERISRAVVMVALLLILLVSLWTNRSIRAPLRRFTAGAHAVAEGRFYDQLDETTGDEFARPAAAFNSMARRLGDLDRMKKDFLAHVSHELKTPLASMQETNALLLDQLVGPLNDRQRRVVSLNLESARRLSAMISNLLDLSRLEAGVLEYDFKPHDFAALVELVVAELESRLKEKGLWLEADLGSRPLTLYGDRDRLIQVVENLYENAIKFSTAAGTVRLDLSVTAVAPPGMPDRWRRRLALLRGSRAVLLAITDCGPGVPEAHKEKIFEKFHQVEKSRASSGRTGVGLGLAICSEIVEAHRGALWVADSPGGGSTFSLLLPVDARPVARPRVVQEVSA